MLREIDRQYSIIHIAGREYRVRYSLNALLCLEMMYKPVEEFPEPKEWTDEDIYQLVRAALCSLPMNFRSVDRRCFEKVRPGMSKLRELIRPEDHPRLSYEIATALMQAFPDEKGTVTEEGKKYYSGIGHTKAIYCDVMGHSEKDFWRSTHREIIGSINYYMEAKGLKDRPVVVKQFDDD